MIAKGKSIRHLSASINYALSREKAVVLDKNIVSETPKDVAKEFKTFQAINQRCERNSFSFVISPTVKDGKKLSEAQLRYINTEFLKKMELDQHQYISFVHQNTQHKHIHLYVNRINYQGKAYNDRFISNRCANIAEGIAKEWGLGTAKQAKMSRMWERKIDTPQISDVQKLAHHTLKQKEVASVDGFVDAFNRSGAERGWRAEAYLNKSGAFSGLRFYIGDNKFKASEVDRSLSKQKIEKRLALNQEISLELEKENNSTRSISRGL